MEFSTILFGVSQFVKYCSRKTTVVLVCSEICINNNVNVMSMCRKILSWQSSNSEGFLTRLRFYNCPNDITDDLTNADMDPWEYECQSTSSLQKSFGVGWWDEGRGPGWKLPNLYHGWRCDLARTQFPIRGFQCFWPKEYIYFSVLLSISCREKEFAVISSQQGERVSLGQSLSQFCFFLASIVELKSLPCNGG